MAAAAVGARRTCPSCPSVRRVPLARGRPDGLAMVRDRQRSGLAVGARPVGGHADGGLARNASPARVRRRSSADEGSASHDAGPTQDPSHAYLAGATDRMPAVRRARGLTGSCKPRRADQFVLTLDPLVRSGPAGSVSPIPPRAAAGTRPGFLGVAIDEDSNSAAHSDGHGQRDPVRASAGLAVTGPFSPSPPGRPVPGCRPGSSRARSDRSIAIVNARASPVGSDTGY
jgi:hypothetical protein